MLPSQAKGERKGGERERVGESVQPLTLPHTLMHVIRVESMQMRVREKGTKIVFSFIFPDLDLSLIFLL